MRPAKPRSADKMLYGEALLEEWDRKRSYGVTIEQWAKELGVTRDSLDSRLTRASRKCKRRRGGSNIPEEFPKSEGVHFEEDGNYLKAEGVTHRIKNLDDLVAECGIDLEIWQCKEFKLNKWEVGAKTAKKHLVFSGGLIIEGTIDQRDALTVEPLFQVKATFVKRHPEPLTPIIQPVAIDPKALRIASRGTGKVGACKDGYLRALVIPDIQIGFKRNIQSGNLVPFHDRGAMSIVQQVAQNIVFDRIVLLGDALDLAEWSDRFVKAPDFRYSTQPAVLELSWWICQLSMAAPKAKITLIEGNHEVRIESSLAMHLDCAFQLRPADEMELPAALSVPRLLALHTMGVQWISGYPDAKLWLNDRLVCEHGNIVSSIPGDTAKKVIQKSSVSVIFGHIHRREQATRTATYRNDSVEIVAVSPGCLCRTDGVVPGHNTGQNWQQGFAIATYRADGFHSIETIPITDGVAVCQGKVYKAFDYTPALTADTHWKHF